MSDLGSRVIRAVREVAAAAPETVYDKTVSGGGKCCYVFDGKPSCIVGHAMWNLSMINESFEKDDSNSLAVEGVAALDDVKGSELEWLQEVQTRQDTGTTWASAVRRADELVKS